MRPTRLQSEVDVVVSGRGGGEVGSFFPLSSRLLVDLASCSGTSSPDRKTAARHDTALKCPPPLPPRLIAPRDSHVLYAERGRPTHPNRTYTVCHAKPSILLTSSCEQAGDSGLKRVRPRSDPFETWEQG